MTIINVSTAAALRARALPTLVSPFAGIDRKWREVVSTGMRNASPVNHNSIDPTTGAVPATAGRVAYGAAKQAAPPRGIPR